MKQNLLFTIAVLLTAMANAQTQNQVAKFDANSTAADCISLNEDATGNVGIGTPAPAAWLHINQNAFTVNATLTDYLNITNTTLLAAELILLRKATRCS